MKKTLFLVICAIILSIAINSKIYAIPIIAIDTDPLTTGLQSSLDITIGDIFTVDVLVMGIDTLNPLGAFQFDIAYDPSVFEALSVTSANSLAPPFFSQHTLTPEVRLADTSISFNTGSNSELFPYGDFRLASVTFGGIGLGNSILALNDTTLTDSFLFSESISHNTMDADVRVAPVPEPATILLLTTGMLGISIIGRKKIRKIS